MSSGRERGSSSARRWPSAIPYVGVSLLDLQHDLYYGAYFAITLAMLAAYVRSEHVDIRALFTRNWIWSLAVGVPVAAFVVWNVFRTDDATARPHGAYFAFEILWRGVGYGTVDALLLTVFPCVVAYSMLHGHIGGILGRARYIAIALPMILVITATYHLGYPQYRAGWRREAGDRQHAHLDPDAGDGEPDRLDRRTCLDARHGRDALVRDDHFLPPQTDS